MDSFHNADAVEVLFTLSGGDKLIDETRRGCSQKTKRTRAPRHRHLQPAWTIRLGAALLQPLCPAPRRDTAAARHGFREFEYGELLPGTKLGEARIRSSASTRRKACRSRKSHEEKPAEQPAVPEPEHEPEIPIEHFMGTELRVALVKECEPVPKAKKLLKLTLDLGYETRTVVSGIAEFYKPEDLVGKKVVCVANLKPAVLRGVESRGMILASSSADGKSQCSLPTQPRRQSKIKGIIKAKTAERRGSLPRAPLTSHRR